jgi:hypothetical protein
MPQDFVSSCPSAQPHPSCHRRSPLHPATPMSPLLVIPPVNRTQAATTGHASVQPHPSHRHLSFLHPSDSEHVGETQCLTIRRVRALNQGKKLPSETNVVRYWSPIPFLNSMNIQTLALVSACQFQFLILILNANIQTLPNGYHIVVLVFSFLVQMVGMLKML